MRGLGGETAYHSLLSNFRPFRVTVPQITMLLVSTVALALWIAAELVPGNLYVPEGSYRERISRQLRMHSSSPSPSPPAAPPQDIRGRSWYFVLVDSFSRVDGHTEACSIDKPGWCNGTLRGVTAQLDYIQGMGFGCVWITPVLRQLAGPDPDGQSGYGQYGYWAYGWYDIDEHFGTKEDLLELSAELHKRGMCLIYDMVVNHVGPVHSSADVHKISPFNETWYYNTPEIGDRTFDEYAGGHPPQGIGPGAMCPENLPDGCNNYKCPVEHAFGSPCPVTPTYIGESAPGPPEIPYCGLGDLICESYDSQRVREGWFFTLADLNQSVPFVHDELIRWGKYMVDTYKIDGIRMDTAPYVPTSFLVDFQAAIGVPILGEVGTSNFSFFAQYSPAAGPRVLDGLLNFPVSGLLAPSFCGAFFPGAVLNLTRLGAAMTQSLTSGLLSDVDLLGNFADNHDQARLTHLCQGDSSRIANALTFTMLYQGIPIIYYGTEAGLNGTRDSMWQHGWDKNTDGYKFVKDLNRVRTSQNLGLKKAEVKFANESALVFTRGGDSDTWVYLNNLKEGSQNVQYCGVSPPEGSSSSSWRNLLTRDPVDVHNGCVVAPNGGPLVLGLLHNGAA